MENIINSILKIDLLSSIDKTVFLNSITDGKILIRTYPKNQIVNHSLESCQSLDILLKGKLTINRCDEEGNIVHITQFNKGDSLGGNLLFATHNIFPFDISTLEESTLLHISKPTVIEFLEDNRNFLLSFLNDLSDKATILTHTISTLSEKTLRQKIIQFLEKESQFQNSNKVHLKHSKKQLAERFGVARTSLSRELKKMQDEGLIHFDNKTITLYHP